MDMKAEKRKAIILNSIFLIIIVIMCGLGYSRINSHLQIFGITQIESTAGGSHFIPFNSLLFQEAKNTGKPIVVNLTAEWCQSCKLQRKNIEEILPDPYFNQILFMRVDYDLDQDVYQYFQQK